MIAIFTFLITLFGCQDSFLALQCLRCYLRWCNWNSGALGIRTGSHVPEFMLMALGQLLSIFGSPFPCLKIRSNNSTFFIELLEESKENSQ